MSQSKYPSQIPKPNVIKQKERNAITNGFALIIPHKKILITAKTKNGSQPAITARNLKNNIATMFPSLDTRIKRNANGLTNEFPSKLKERLPSESALANQPMNTLMKKGKISISLVISF